MIVPVVVCYYGNKLYIADNRLTVLFRFLVYTYGNVEFQYPAYKVLPRVLGGNEISQGISAQSCGAVLPLYFFNTAEHMGVIPYNNICSRVRKNFGSTPLIIADNVGIFHSPVKSYYTHIGYFIGGGNFGLHSFDIVSVPDRKLAFRRQTEAVKGFSIGQKRERYAIKFGSTDICPVSGISVRSAYNG